MDDPKSSLRTGWVVVALAAIVASIVMAVLMRHRTSAIDPAPPAQPASDEQIPPPLYDAPTFTLIDQDGKPFNSDQLKGRAWLADFIFTRCGGPCPLMTQRMREAQKAMGNAPVMLVSFSLDPEYDKPAALKEYARTSGIDENNWRLLTGNAAEIYAIAKGFRMTAIPASGEQPIVHDTHFALVDQDGKVRSFYSGQDGEGWRRAAAAAMKLAAMPAPSTRP